MNNVECGTTSRCGKLGIYLGKNTSLKAAATRWTLGKLSPVFAKKSTNASHQD
jgi:hypothetical protein